MLTEIEKSLKAHISRLKTGDVPGAEFGDFIRYPKVSVITPSYNQGAYLERTIISVLNQDWPNLEYIIIDGGSDDDTVEIIERYESRLSSWVSEPDGGQSDAINKGLARATGAYVTWICSDDILLPGAVETMVRAMEEHPSAGIVYGGVVFIDEEDRPQKVLTYEDMTREKLLYHKHSTIAQPSSLMRKKILDEVGGLDPSLSYAMDYDLWIKILGCSESVNLHRTILSGYRLHVESKTVGSYRKMALEKIRVNRKHTGDAMNRVIRSHYWYIVEDGVRRLRRNLRSRTGAR